MKQSNDILLKEASVFQRCPFVEVSLYACCVYVHLHMHMYMYMPASCLHGNNCGII